METGFCGISLFKSFVAALCFLPMLAMAGKRDYSNSGVNSLRKALSTRHRGKLRCMVMDKLDKRSRFARVLEEWRSGVIESRGGVDAFTPQMHTILDAIITDMILLAQLDTYLRTLPSIVNHRKRAVLPVVEQRMRIADSLIKHLQAIGLDRVSPQAVGLYTFLMQQPPGASPAGDSDDGQPQNTAPSVLLGDKKQDSNAPDRGENAMEDK